MLSTSMPELKSQLDATRKFKAGETDKNFVIAEKVIEEKNEDNQSSLKEVSPLVHSTSCRFILRFDTSATS